MKRKLLAAALAAAFGAAAFAQSPASNKAAGGRPAPAAGTTPSADGTTGTTTATADTNPVKAELDELTAFIDDLVEEFQLEFQSEQEAQIFVLGVTHFYLTAKLQAGGEGGFGKGGRATNTDRR